MSPQTPKTKESPGDGTMYRFIGDRAVVLESGQPLGPGEYVMLKENEIIGSNQMLVNEGKLIDATGAAPEPGPQATAREEE